MRCEDGQYHVFDDYGDDYVDGLLSTQQVSLFDNHLSECSICRSRLQQHTAYLATLSHFEAPIPRASTIRAILQTGRKPSQQRRTVWLQGFVTASIMSIVIATGLWSFDRYWQPSSFSVSAIDRPRLIDVSITAPMDMGNVVLTLVLPEGLALDGFGDVDEITWRVDLKAGINNLTLPIRFLTKSVQQDVVNIDVLMQYRDRERRFQIGINVHSLVNDRHGKRPDNTVKMYGKV